MNVNGADYTKNYLRHENLLKGGTISVEMSNQPNQNRGTKEEDMPYSSLSNNNPCEIIYPNLV